METKMKLSVLLVFVLSAFTAQLALANAELAKAKNCMACHAVANKIVGPSYKDVAAKYAGKKGVEDKLVKKVMEGGVGVWGAVAMPANKQVNEAEARALVKWILSIK